MPPVGEGHQKLAREAFVFDCRTGFHIAGLRRYRQEVTSSSPILLLHGSGVGMQAWDLPVPGYSTMDYLAERGFDVYAVNQRGYAPSQDCEGLAVDARSSAADIIAVLEYIRERSNGEPVGLAAHSWGGAVAGIVAAQAPQSVKRLALIGSPYRTVSTQFRKTVDHIATLIAKGAQSVPNQHHLGLTERTVTIEPAVEREYQELVATRYPSMPAGIFRDYVDFAYAAAIPRIQMATLIMLGESEYVQERDDALRCLDDLASKEKELLVIGGKHLTFLEKEAHIQMQRALAAWFSY